MSPSRTHEGHRARKRFGQNFLHEQGIIQRIVDAIGPKAGDRLVEIGPGLGALTGPLLAATGALDAVELDRDLVERLTDKFRNQGELRIHSADALKFDFCGLAVGDQRLRVIGNLPYNISTPLLFHLFAQRQCIQDMHFMLQKEVVDRLAAGPGSKTYGRLSVMAQFFCQIQPLIHVPPGCFQPPPKVDSAVVRLIPRGTADQIAADPEKLGRTVTQAFAQRRKTLRNNLKGLVDAATIESLGIDPGTRPETLSLEQFAALANTLEY